MASSQYDTEQEYWINSSGRVRPENALFLQWFNQIRASLFQPNRTAFSLEVGAGTGGFVEEANIKVAVDLSQDALNTLRQVHNCQVVVADAAHLPFKNRCFDEIYIIDVCHHLKAEGTLRESVEEMKRALSSQGILYVADRLPTRLNKYLLKVIAFARSIFVSTSKLVNRPIYLTGSDNELHLEEEDYKAITKGMTVDSENVWMSWLVYVLLGLLQFTGIVLPEKLQIKIGQQFLKVSKYSEAKLGIVQKISVCLRLTKN